MYRKNNRDDNIALDTQERNRNNLFSDEKPTTKFVKNDIITGRPTVKEDVEKAFRMSGRDEVPTDSRVLDDKHILQRANFPLPRWKKNARNVRVTLI